ncbi:MAG: hypothetical protein U0842_19080 [Candidatus Binatia bacterium]
MEAKGSLVLKHVLGAFVALVATAAAMPTRAHAMNVGIYGMCEGAGRLNQVNPITAAGHTAWIVEDLTLAEFQAKNLDALMVDNCDNFAYGQEYLDHLADIETAVANGMVLILHDRYVDPAETILPGGEAFDVRRDLFVGAGTDRQINVLDGSTLITNGPAGTIDNTTLDNGCSSNHGFTVVGSVPEDARFILTRDDSAELVTFAYGYGKGAVIYSTIPLDFYLNTSNNCGPAAAMRNVYAVNLVHYTSTLIESACGNGAVDAGEQCDFGAENNGTSCCGFDCRIRSAGVTCRDADGVCDEPEVCDGASASCPVDAFAAGTTLCRPATDVCDRADFCTGTDAACPADALEPATTVCRPAADDCDLADSCTGTDAACPADAVKPDADGDTVCDFLDNCDATPNADQADADADDEGDACDLCTAVSPAVQAKGTKIVVGKLTTPPGDDKLAIVGSFSGATLPPLGDLVTTGVRFVLDEVGGLPLDVTIPGGAFDKGTKIGWKVNGTGTSATYVNASASPIQGITGVSVRKTKTPGQVKFTVRGKKSAYPVSVGDLPLNVTLVLDPPLAETGQCVATTFAPASCKFSVSGATATCK